MQIFIKGGTPQHGKSLCATCRWVHMVRGYRESEDVIICTYIDPNLEVKFAVRECTHFRSSVVPTPQQMESMALIIPVERTRKPAGFAKAGTAVEEEPATVVVAGE